MTKTQLSEAYERGNQVINRLVMSLPKEDYPETGICDAENKISTVENSKAVSIKGRATYYTCIAADMANITDRLTRKI
jgi:hypothetical protein